LVASVEGYLVRAVVALLYKSRPGSGADGWLVALVLVNGEPDVEFETDLIGE
jgi:hypothetical protein